MILEKYFEETFSEREMPKKSELLQNLAADARRAAARNFGAEVLGSLAGAARENAVWLALSLVEEADDGRFYHTAFLVDGSGTVVGKYRKAHLGAEEAWATRGDSLSPVFATPLGSFAFVLGDEMWIPEVARCLALAGVEVLLHPTSWGTELS